MLWVFISSLMAKDYYRYNILDDFEINDISGYGSIAYGENIIEADLSKEDVFGIAEQNLVSGTLTPELQRIYSENSPRRYIS